MTASSSIPNGCSQEVDVEKNTWYRFSYWTKGSDVGAYYHHKGRSFLSVNRTYVDPYLETDGWIKKQYYFTNIHSDGKSHMTFWNL